MFWNGFTLRISRRQFAPLLVVLFVGGCGKEFRGHPLHGTVTFEGQPVSQGTATFHPDRTKGNKGSFGVAEITNGVFQTTPDYGVSHGAVRVTFTIFDGTPEHRLVANIQNFAVDIPAGTKQWEFNLTSKDVQEFRP